MKTNLVIVFCITVLFQGSMVLAKRSRSRLNEFQVELLKLNIEADPRLLIVSHNIYEKALLDLNITALTSFVKGNTLFSMIVKIHSGAADFFQTLIKFNSNDFCDYWATTAKDPLVRLVSGRSQQYTNIKTCPIEKGEYYIRNFTAKGIIPVGIIPDGEYLVDASILHKDFPDSRSNFSLVINVVN